MYFFKYWVDYVNEAGNDFDHSSGVVYANDYCGAMEKIGRYYGDNLIEKVEIQATYEETVYECDVKEEE